MQIIYFLCKYINNICTRRTGKLIIEGSGAEKVFLCPFILCSLEGDGGECPSLLEILFLGNILFLGRDEIWCVILSGSILLEFTLECSNFRAVSALRMNTT